MPDNEILRARRQVITAAVYQETPAQIVNRNLVDIVGAIAVLGGIVLTIWAVLHV